MVSEMMPRYEHLEKRLEDHMKNDDNRYARIELQVGSIDGKVDGLKSWADNLSGRLVIVGFVIAFVGPAVVGLILKYM